MVPPQRKTRTQRTTPTLKTPRGEDSLVRLQKVLASAGFGSRRHCEEFIQSGRVTVDGKTVVELGRRVDPAKQKIQLDGETVTVEKKVYYVLNKPTGYLCTHSDPAGRRRVIDLFPKAKQRLFTVGRLDENSEGLILVTNDGEFANRLAHPRYRVSRVYEVQVAGIPTPDILRQMREGLRFSEGFFRVDRARRVRVKGKTAVLQLTLNQGRNREIRRLLARLGHKVIKLRRVQFGPINLGRVNLGEHRTLTPREVKQLESLLETEGPTRTRRPPRKAAPATKSNRDPATKSKHTPSAKTKHTPSVKTKHTPSVKTKRASSAKSKGAPSAKKRPQQKATKSRRR
jgi:23S rRNA pseudouridine2605 synthase